MGSKAFLLTLVLAIMLGFKGMATPNLPPDREQNARMLINLLDYIGKDYINAVSDGKVINSYEFDEMQEFAEKSLFYYEEITKDGQYGNDTLRANFGKLKSLVQAKSDPKIITAVSASLKKEILKFNLVQIAPENWPDLAAGRKIFLMQCSACHGVNADGKGEAGVGLNPLPTDFTDHNLMNDFSPFQAYNVIQTGIPGTSMISYAQLTDEEVWNLAFYINSVSYGEPGEKRIKTQPSVALTEAAALTDNELIVKYDLDPEGIKGLRQYSVNPSENSPLKLAKRYLNKANEAYEKGDIESARNLALKAYLEGIEPVENRINASDNKLVGELEKSMMGIRTAIGDKVTLDELRSLTDIAGENIDRAEEVIGGQKSSIGFTAFMSASILLREGLEAFLIIIAIIGILRSVQADNAVRWVHSGWISAVLVGVASWFFTDQLINWGARNRELMEGLIALFAVTVLLYIGFWMHRKTEISRWKTFVEDKVKGLVKRNNLIGLAVFSFLVVFREAFESVIFLSSWSLESGKENQAGVWSGVAIAATLLVIISWALLRFFNKIPLRQFFLYFSIVVVFMAIILAGEGIHALQESGYSTVTSMPLNARFGMLGIYPTWETVAGQLLTLALAVILWRANSMKKKS